MIRGESVKRLIESGGQRDPMRAVRHIYEGLGLADEAGRRVYDSNQMPHWGHMQERRKKGGYLPNEFSVRELCESFCGPNWADKMMRFGALAAAHVGQFESQSGVPLLEAAGTNPVVPADFIDVTALIASITGLYEVALLEGFNRVEFIADKVCPPDPTKTFGGKKVIGTGGMGNKAEIRKPGMPTHRSNLKEKWINTPETNERADSIEVLYETLYLDLTGTITEQANDGGYYLGYHRDLEVIDCLIGVSTATQYNFNGASYNTFLTSGFYANDLGSNELVHETNVQNALILFRDMLDPITGLRILVQPNLMIVNMEKERTARAILGDTAQGYEYRDIPGSTSAPQEINVSSPAYKGRFEILQSPLIYQRCIDADGLNLSASDAGKYWWLLDTRNGGFIRWAQNWPLRIQQATPSQLDMVDRGVAMFIKYDYRGEVYVREPRRAVRCKP